MQALLDTLQKVVNRIQNHTALLQVNEMLTRYTLIDPVLRALGWDTEDPTAVVPELSTQTGRPDYALLYNNQPIIMVEAKALYGNLQQAMQAGFQYCWQNGVPYYLITDGNTWELYDMQVMGGKNIFSLTLTGKTTPLADAARMLLAIWHPAMPVVAPAPPLVIPSSPSSTTIPIPATASGTSVPTSVSPASTQNSQRSLTPPSQIDLGRLQSVIKYGMSPPKQVQFPNGHKQTVSGWSGLLTEVAIWVFPSLQQFGKLPFGNLIVNNPNSQRRPKPVGNGWYMEASWSAPDSVKHANSLAQAAGVAPSQIIVIF